MKTKTIPVSKNPSVNWKNNDIQFPRLLSEIQAVGLSPHQYKQIAELMDLDTSQIDALFERADAVWADLKRRSR